MVAVSVTVAVAAAVAVVAIEIRVIVVVVMVAGLSRAASHDGHNLTTQKTTTMLTMVTTKIRIGTPILVRKKASGSQGGRRPRGPRCRRR